MYEKIVCHIPGVIKLRDLSMNSQAVYHAQILQNVLMCFGHYVVGEDVLTIINMSIKDVFVTIKIVIIKQTGLGYKWLTG